MGIYSNNAKRDLTTLLNSIQKGIQNEKPMRTLNIEDRVSPIIDNIILEVKQQILNELKNERKNKN